MAKLHRNGKALAKRRKTMEIFEKHPHWPCVLEVIETLSTAGFKAWLAGGCVRDALIGRTPGDFDVATDAHPEQVEELFVKTIAVGKAFGVIVVPFDQGNIEIATFRRDGDYKDGRHPEEIEFSAPEEDAKRRDFTINSLFYDISAKKVIDYVDGGKDLARRIIRAVGEPKRRFTEDRLRLLRAIRFAAQLDFTIEGGTYTELVRQSHDVVSVSGERVHSEIEKILRSVEVVKGLQLMESTGLLGALFPHLCRHLSQGDGWAECKERLSRGQTLSEAAKWALLFRGAVNVFDREEKLMSSIKELHDAELHFLKFSKKELQEMMWTWRALWAFEHVHELRPGAVIEKVAGPQSEDLLQLELAQNSVFFTRFEEWKIKTGLQLALKELPEKKVTGEKLLKMGFKPGKKVGDILQECFLRQLEGQSAEVTCEWVRQNLKKSV